MRAGPVTVQGLSSPELLNYLRLVDRRPQGGCAGLTSPPAVASRAEVSPATVYRHFPGLDDLILGVLRVMRPRIGQTHKRLAGVAPDGLADLTRENFDSYEEHADVLVPLMESRAFNRVRVGSEGRRAPLGADVLRPLAPSAIWSMAGAVFLLMRTQAWRWLRETHHRPRPLQRGGTDPDIRSVP